MPAETPWGRLDSTQPCSGLPISPGSTWLSQPWNKESPSEGTPHAASSWPGKRSPCCSAITSEPLGPQGLSGYPVQPRAVPLRTSIPDPHQPSAPSPHVTINKQPRWQKITSILVSMCSYPEEECPAGPARSGRQRCSVESRGSGGRSRPSQPRAARVRNRRPPPGLAPGRS